MSNKLISGLYSIRNNCEVVRRSQIATARFTRYPTFDEDPWILLFGQAEPPIWPDWWVLVIWGAENELFSTNSDLYFMNCCIRIVNLNNMYSNVGLLRAIVSILSVWRCSRRPERPGHGWLD